MKVQVLVSQYLKLKCEGMEEIGNARRKRNDLVLCITERRNAPSVDCDMFRKLEPVLRNWVVAF